MTRATQQGCMVTLAGEVLRSRNKGFLMEFTMAADGISCGSEPPRSIAVAADAPSLQKDSSAACNRPPDWIIPRLAAVDTSAVPVPQMTPKTPFRAAFAVASAREATVAASHDVPGEELVAPSAAPASAHKASSSSSKSCLPAADCSVHSAASEMAPSATFGLGLLDAFATD